MGGMFPSLSAGASVAIGILVGLCSTCIQSFGLTLQRKSHMLEDEKEDCEPRRPAYRRRRWQIGMLLFLMANVVGSTIQITTLPLPLLSTLQASGLVFNSLLASLLLKEAWTWRTGYGTILVAAGAVLISLFSALPEPSHSLWQLIELLGHRGFLVWFILSLVLVLALLVTDFALRKFMQDTPRLQLVRGMCYGAASGILAAHALLLAKSAVELIVRSVADKSNQFSGYQSWLLIIAFLVLALSQLYYLHLGLRLISTSVLYPFVFCIYNIVAILDGLIYFRQTDRLPPLHAGLIALGTVILLAGVLALSWRLQEEETGDDQHKRHQMAQHDIPQTVLTPGLGFVGDPSDSEENESAIADDEGDLTADEEDPLISRGKKRTSTNRSTRTNLIKKRKRAATLKEVIDIWEELGDGEEAAYGTFNGAGDNHPSDGRPRSAGHVRQTRRRRDSAGLSLEADRVDGDGDGGDLEVSVGRARTMPTQRRSRSGRRRSTHGGGSGALFKDMLTRDWWRTRRKSVGDGPNDEGGV
ncbi:hypothetical protein LTR53_002688 [Teratosphaeriaceae sp. CCFEE 6253]|nr:hypothetical protein LTR53_002688 [Teratosphaeriaceae sp. CCFEE 6253]